MKTLIAVTLALAAVAGLPVPAAQAASERTPYFRCGDIGRETRMAVIGIHGTRKCFVARRMARIWRKKVSKPGPQTCDFNFCRALYYACELEYLIPAGPDRNAQAGIICRRGWDRVRFLAIQRFPGD
jgi:hypothetical protein